MADYLQVQAERHNEVCVLRITGELDASKADAFADNADAVVRTMPRPVLVDLSGLTFIDAHGAHSLAALLQSLRAGGWPLSARVPRTSAVLWSCSACPRTTYWAGTGKLRSLRLAN